MRQKTCVILVGLGFLMSLLIIRLLFFLKDGTSDTIETLLIATIYGGSFLLVLYLFVYPYDTFKARIRPYLKSIIIAIAIVMLDLVFIIRNGLDLDRMYLFSTLLIFTLVFTLTMHVQHKTRIVIHLTLFLIVAVYLIVQDGYYYIFNDLFSFKELGTLREGIESSESMINITWFHLYTLIVLFITIVMIRKLPIVKTPQHDFKKGILYSLLLLVLVNINAQYPVKQARLHTSDHYLYSSVFSKTSFMSTYGSTNLLFRDLTKSITPNFSLKKSIDFVDSYATIFQETRDDNLYTGMFEGKNLLYIVGESFDDLVVNETLTPHLYKIKTEGWNFDNHYAPVYPRTTCDAEIIMNTSLIPSIEDGPTCYVYNDNSYSTSLANRFNNHNYITQAFHNNYKEFYTRDVVYDGLGYNRFYGQNELNLSETDIRYDHVFFDKAKETMIMDNQPFFSFVLTLSGHSPFTTSNLAGHAHYDLVDAYYHDTVSETMKYYIATQVEFDQMLGDMLAYLETNNLLDDTVIILTTDHYPYTLNQDDYTAFKGITDDYQKHHSPLYIYTEGITPMTISKLTTSFDILPTIMNLFNLDGDFTYYVGHDIFSAYQSHVYYKDYSIYDGSAHFYLTDEAKPEDEQLYHKVQSYYDLSKHILRSNYLNNKNPS
ncbi:MAG: LTA synthase family protein [Bacillota bacterium]